jgi:hypothetical protein
VTIPSDQPGWRPDPEKPGMVRWWNGLGWSDARRSADEAIERVRGAAEQAARGSTITPQQVARTTADRRAARGAAGAATGTSTAAGANPLAGAAVAIGIVGFGIGLYGLLPLVGLILSLAGLARSRRLARNGVQRTGLGQSLAGLVLSIIGLTRWIPVIVDLLPGLQNVLSS